MRIERIAKAFDVDIRYTQFPLHPETPDEGLTLEALFAGRAFDVEAAQVRMTALMASEGLPFGRRTMTYNSRLAQELGKWGERQPGGEAIHDALFKAYFVDGINLARVDDLVEIARSVGLPTGEAGVVLAERSYRAEVDADWAHARSYGITGVPTFVVGDRGLVGAQPYEMLEQLVDGAGAARR